MGVTRNLKRELTPAVDGPVIFSMRDVPLLEQGTTYENLSTAENLWLALKVYASGGENALHSHEGEDHAFVVMQGKATFTFGDGHTEIVGLHEGVMIPKGSAYKFEADTAENLILMRVGGGARKATGLDRLTRFGTPKDVSEQTLDASGAVKAGRSTQNGESGKQSVFAEGKFFSPSPR
jgi:mannose-6-phosphate isomerase-like protein (cupin superfamily)